MLDDDQTFEVEVLENLLHIYWWVVIKNVRLLLGFFLSNCAFWVKMLIKIAVHGKHQVVLMMW